MAKGHIDATNVLLTAGASMNEPIDKVNDAHLAQSCGAANFAQMIVNFMDRFVGINPFCNPALIRDKNKDIASF